MFKVVDVISDFDGSMHWDIMLDNEIVYTIANLSINKDTLECLLNKIYALLKTRAPTHPGIIIKEHYMKPMCLTTTQVAKALGVSRKTVSAIVNKKSSITPNVALRLSKLFKTTPEMWLNLQNNFDLWRLK